MQGSRDFGAQLFCALLRSVAVEARLVCSLQPLPFSGAMQPPQKPEPEPIVISSDDPDSLTDGSTKSEAKLVPIRRIGRPGFKPTRVQNTTVLSSRTSLDQLKGFTDNYRTHTERVFISCFLG